MKLNVLNIVPDTIVDGPRMRTSIYLSGCTHCCPGCHNSSSWVFGSGKDYDSKELIELIKSYDHKRLTISGGDGLCFQYKELTVFLKEATEEIPDINIWVYTGYVWEDLLGDPERRDVLKYIDVLVDGRFDKSLKSKNCLYRGSTNQRLIDVKQSLNKNRVILYDV